MSFCQDITSNINKEYSDKLNNIYDILILLYMQYNYFLIKLSNNII